MGTMDSVDESNDEPIYTDMLEEIRDISKYHPTVNRI